MNAKKEVSSSNQSVIKRGRRPISEAGNKICLDSKKLAKLREAKKKGLDVVYIGNKLVDKKSPEYIEKRKKNRELNRQWKNRVKLEQEQNEIELAELEKNNKNSEGTIELLRKEAYEKKYQILKLNDKQLPENIKEMFSHLDKLDENDSE